MNLIENLALLQEEQMLQPPGVILRIDRVGSFRLILADQVILGGPSSREENVIRIMAPLSSRHACIRRNTNGYSIKPLRGAVEMRANSDQKNANQKKEARLLLGETCFGNNAQAMLTSEIGVRLEIVSPLSQSARLIVTPERRLDQGLDGLVLMEKMILLGPGGKIHIPCEHWEQAGALIFRDGSFRFCAPVGLGSLGKNETGETIDEPINLNQHYCFDEIGFYLEA